MNYKKNIGILFGAALLIVSATCVNALVFVGYGDPDTTDDTWSDASGGSLIVSNVTAGGTATIGTLSATTQSATTLSVSGASTLSGSVTVIGGSITSRWDNASSKIDGEQIADDTIDDDSIDFADVTGADLTLTDCGAITSSGAVQGATLALSATQWFDVINTTQLVFIADGVTNVIDADITTP